MPRVLLLLTLVCAMSSSLVAEDAIESARVALDKAKKLYTDTAERSKADLQSAVTREIKRQRANSKRSVEDQIAHIETLETELRLFQNEHVLPKADVLKDEVTDYKESLRKAKLKCEKPNEPTNKIIGTKTCSFPNDSLITLIDLSIKSFF